MEILLISVFSLGYLLIAFEHNIRIDKAAIALITGVLTWTIFVFYSDHHFIDEFQDTSIIQWQNLLPLIENSLASIGSCLIVGDGKQSIYRWRGGEVEQFIKLCNEKNTHELQQFSPNT